MDNLNDIVAMMVEAVKEHISFEVAALNDRISSIENRLSLIDSNWEDQKVLINTAKDELWVELRHSVDALKTRAEDAISRCEAIKPLNGEPGKDGRDGRDGKDGESGRDAISLDILPGIDETRSYPPRTYAHHNGGIWVSRRKTEGLDGWECVVQGIASVNYEQENERSAKMVIGLSTGETRESVISYSTPLYRGVYNDATAYELGDCITYAGSIWIATESGPGRPESDRSGWRLAVKKGRDGKSGKNGVDGKRGEQGPPGTYLNHLNNQIQVGFEK